MYAGRVVEQGTLDEIFYDPQHPYTWGLLGSLTRIDRPRPTGCRRSAVRPVAARTAAGLRLPAALPARVRQLHRAAGLEARLADGPATSIAAGSTERKARAAPGRGQDRPRGPRMSGEALLEVTDLVKHFPVKRGLLIDRTVDHVRAVDGVSLTSARARRSAWWASRAAGKSTLCRTILHLIEPTSGSIRFEGREIAGLSRRRDAAVAARDADGLPGPLRLAQPAQAGRADRRRPAEAAGSRLGSRAAPPGLRAARAGRPRRRALQPLPARVLRRTATADRDRAGAGACSPSW